MADELDSIDHKILQTLKRDGRIPVAQIAEETGLSRPSVAERIEKLEREGYLRGITAVLDPDKMGNGVTAFVAARHSMPIGARTEKALEQLIARKEILEVHSVAGDDCYLIKVRTGSIRTLNEIVSSLTAAPLHMATRTTIVMETYFEKVGGVELKRRHGRKEKRS